jgi:hypothetical protein
MHNGPEAPVFFVDDSVPASSRARIDSENPHVGKVGIGPDRARQVDTATTGSDTTMIGQ